MMTYKLNKMFIILGLLMLLVTTNPFSAALEPKEKKKFHVLLVVVLFSLCSTYRHVCSCAEENQHQHMDCTFLLSQGSTKNWLVISGVSMGC
jgi:hypothetical protein